MEIKILIVDDHPAMIEGYKSILNCNTSGLTCTVVEAHTCSEAQKIIISDAFFDVIFLDIILPPSPDLKIHSGVDLAMLVRKVRPDTKLVVLTSHTESFILYSIIKGARPDGFLVKSDFSANEFLIAFDKIFRGETVYSNTVQKSIKNVSQKDYYLDTYNRQIISLLAQGIKTKNIPLYLNLSISAIDKRKSQIKDFLEIEKGNDEDIIRAARIRGFI